MRFQIPDARFRKITILLILASGIWHPASASTIDSYESAKKHLGSLKAHFVQKKVFTLFEETETSEGEVWFKRPNQVLWRYQSPAPSDTILAGENSWNISPATKQVQKIRVVGGNGNRVFQIIGFGESKEKLTDSFDVKPLPSEDDLEILSLVPKENSLKPYYSEIIVKLSKTDYLPRHVILKEKSGDITEILLSDLKTNISVTDSLFEFKVPEGYQLVEY